MRKTKTLEINDRIITIKEMSVREIKEMFEAQEKQSADRQPTTIDLIFGNEITSDTIAMCSGIKVEELEESFTPSEIGQIVEVIKELNPFFFDLMGRLIKAAQGVLSQQQV